MKLTNPLIPVNLTTVERDAIVSPLTGSLIENTTVGYLQRYDGTTWVSFLPSINTSVKLGVDSAVPANTSIQAYTQLLGMSIIPPTAGEYIVMFSAQHQVSLNNTVTDYAIFLDGVIVPGTTRRIKHSGANDRSEVTLLKKIIYTSGVIDIRAVRVSGGGFSTSVNRTMVVF